MNKITENSQQDTRTKIFLTAARLFATQGYNGVSIREICEAVGVAKPALYYYFKDKETLLEELLIYAFNNLNELTTKLIQKQAGFYERLHGLIKLRQIFARQFPYFIRFFISTNVLSLPESAKKLMVDHHNWVHTRMTEFMEEGKQEGVVKKNVPPHLMAFSVLGGLNQLTMRNIIQNNQEHVSDQDAEELLNFWKQYFFKSEKKRRKK